MEKNKYLLNVQGLIANGRISDAIEEILRLVNGKTELGNFSNDIIALSSRFNKLNKEVRSGLVSISEELIIRNQVISSLLTLIDELASVDVETNKGFFPEDKLSNVGNKNVVLVSPLRGGDLQVQLGDKKVEAKYIERQIKTQNKIKILFIASNPLDTGRLRLEKEMREIDVELSRAKYRDRFEFSKYMDARLDDLLNILLENTPHFVHFSGHGTNEGILLMDDKTEQSHLVKGKNLGNLFKLFSNDIGCVFLNSCYSRQQGKEIVQFIPNVIGMKVAVPDNTAIIFAKAFYKSIGAGREIDFAFEFAKVSIGLYNASGENIPEYLQKP